MARDHARLLVQIWDDPHWVSLATSQQSTYSALLASKDLSWCGVAPLLPQRLAKLASDMTERKVRFNLEILRAEPRRFLIIDESTAEVAVRSYVRHDKILKQPNVTKAMIRALYQVRSDTIRAAIVVELGREFRSEPDLAGWAAMRSVDPDLYAKVSANPSANPSLNPSANPNRNPSRKGA